MNYAPPYSPSIRRVGMSKITHSELYRLYDYNPETGVFTRLFPDGRNNNKKPVGSFDKDGYVKIGINKKTYQAHRLAWFYVHGTWPKDQIDHINGDKQDNRIDNLRVVTGAENSRNQPSRCVGKCHVPGVLWLKRDQVWIAQIKVNKKMIHLGRFKDVDDAIAARQSANKKYGYHPNHGRKPTP
jgi:hypothetical protein